MKQKPSPSRPRAQRTATPMSCECCKWRDMETAPKDGTHILLCNANTGSMDFGSWQTTYAGQPEEESGWRDLGEGFEWSDATHWMPLPALPTQDKETGR